MSELQKVLSDIQKKLVAPKGQFNSFGKYHYRSCEDILEALKRVLPEGTIITINDDIVMVGDRYYVKATVTISKGTESISSSAFARETLDKKGMDDSQLTGSTSSYARKYALNGLFLIDDSKDADHTNEHDKGDQRKAPAKQEPKKEAPKAAPIPAHKNMADIVIGLHKEDAKLDAFEYWAKTTKEEKRGIWPNLNKGQQEWITEVMKNAPKV